MIYAFALIDRVNLPNARIAGMDADLELSVGDRYSLVVMIFFVSWTEEELERVLKPNGEADWRRCLM